MANRDNQSGANRGRLNFIDAYPHTAAPTADVVSAFINDTITPAAAVRPQAASRAAASLLASVEGHGRQLHQHLRENPSVAAKDISAERGLATLQHRWGAHRWVPAAYAPRPPIAPLIIRKMVWITDKAVITSGASNPTKAVATQAAKMLAAELAVADAEVRSAISNSSSNNDAFLDFRYDDARDDYNPLFGDDNDIPLRDHNIPLVGNEPHGPPAPSSDDDPFRSSPARPAVRSAPGAVRSRPESDSESDAPPRQRRRTISVSSDRDSDSDSDSDSEEAPQPPPARRVRRPRAPPASQEEELDRIAQRVYDTTMSQLRQGTFTSRMRLADRQDIAWHARAAVLDTAVAQEEGIAEPNNEPRAGRAFEDELSSEYDEELMRTPPVRRAGTMFTSLVFDSDDE
ncbi:hypothetical protein COL26b_013698 [Colletotrichum chrysophilum]|nr:uncharacterized protein COL26b_013698 [Colletotrichum chrysophilum]KAJ0361472.1 hypothetical protein COL26b_013698 [Colletotrichum chrysophilum]